MNVRDLGSLLRQVDEASARVIWYLMWEGHAHLDDLARVTGLDHAQVLERIRWVINPLSRKLYGNDLVTFSSCRVDPASGHKVTFAWWLEPPLGDDSVASRYLAEVFEEDGQVLVLAAVGLSLRLSGKVQVSCRNGVLRVVLEKDGFPCPSVSMPTA